MTKGNKPTKVCLYRSDREKVERLTKDEVD